MQEAAEPDAAQQPPLLKKPLTPEELWARLQPASAMGRGDKGSGNGDAGGGRGAGGGGGAADGSGKAGDGGGDASGGGGMTRQQLGMSVSWTFCTLFKKDICLPRKVLVYKGCDLCSLSAMSCHRDRVNAASDTPKRPITLLYTHLGATANDTPCPERHIRVCYCFTLCLSSKTTPCP